MRLILFGKDLLQAFFDWSSDRKIVVIESDDWGSIRMPSTSAFEKLTAKGIDLSSGDSERYNRYDTLASAEDLDRLFGVLRKFKDHKGYHPVITALCLTANPDFNAIRKAEYERYFYEPLDETLKRYYPNQPVFSWWQQGIQDKLFFPQFHGREHVNVNAWMGSLQGGDRETLLAFQEGVWGFNNKHEHNVSFQAAFDLETMADLQDHQVIIEDGLNLFEKIFGYRARFFVPPNGILHESLYRVTKASGIDMMYSAKLHPVPVRPGRFRKRLNYLGRQNSAGQIFITRNCFFEPSQGQENCVNKCIEQIETAFRWRKPAIISTHRVNYIGTLNSKNREGGLQKLWALLLAITKKWPEVEFMTSVQLGELIMANK